MATPVLSAFARSQLVGGNPMVPIVLPFTWVSPGSTLTAGSGTTGIKVGMLVTGAGIQSGSKVTVVTPGTSIEISRPTTSSGSGQFLAFTQSANFLTGLNIHLFAAPLSVVYTTALSALVAVEATFDGYAAIQLAMALGYLNPLGEAVARSQLLTWLMTGSTTPNTIYGYWTDDGTNWWTAEVFAAPYAMPQLGAELDAVLQASEPEGQGIIVLAA